MPQPPRDLPPEEEDDLDLPDDRSRSEAVESLKKSLEGLRAEMARSQVQSVGIFDQFHAFLLDLVRSMDHVGDLDLPPGLRIKLVRAAASLVRSPVIQLYREQEMADSPPADAAYAEALRVVHEIEQLILEERLRARAVRLACEMAPDGDLDLYHELGSDPLLLDELQARHGWEPDDETIRAFIAEQAAQC